ncbi:MAG TPA: beta-galactosidase [Chthoniobacter sp.]|jgi:hypothetical protein
MLAPLRFPITFLPLFLCATISSPAAPLTVRVESPNGAPRIVVNGQPVRARMFFGGPGSSAIPVGPDWQHLDFQFTAAGGADNGTMHFRFGQEPGDVFLDRIQVTDLDEKREVIPLCDFEKGQDDFSREWTFWPTGAANTVGTVTVEPKAGADGSGGLHVHLAPPPASEPWPDFHIYHQPTLHLTEGHHYQVRLAVRAVPARSLHVEFYRPGKTFVHLGGPADPFPDQIRMAAEAGVNFVSFPVDLPWPKPGEPADWSAEDAACRTVLAANPKALLIPRIPMNPPDWWRAAHPDEVMQWEDGHRAAAVPASPLYRREAAERLAALVAHLEKTFSDHLAGYHPVGQNTGEWFYEDTWKHPLNGYAPADLREWRLWLKKHYETDEALRHAWNDGQATLDTAAVPTAAARHAAPAGIFRDPQTEQPIVDWAQFQQEAIADCVCTLAHAAREASAGKKLVLFFYGYVFEFAAVPNGPATSGHYALRRVLDSPDIDILCSPISYFDRGLGGSAPSMSAAESVALAGKMWLNEDDTHTYLATGTPPGSRDHVTTLEATNAELTRNVAEEALRNFSTWWMDLTFTGWFRDRGMWEQMKKLSVLDDTLLQSPTPFHPEIAAVLDEPSMWHVAAGGQAVSGPCVYEARASLGRIGAPYGQYLLDDVAAGKVHAKLYVFLNAWSLTKDQREKLRDATRGSACIWCYAPGWFDGNILSPQQQATLELTGFQTTALGRYKAWATPSAAGKEAGLTQPFGVQKMLTPVLTASATPQETLFTYPGKSAAVTQHTTASGHTSIFVGAPGLTSELLRFAAREAGVHLFTDTDCNVYANGPFIVLHASADGPIHLHPHGAVVDLLSGETVGRGPDVILPLHRGDTRVLRCDP